jgi:hypothetical protein
MMERLMAPVLSHQRNRSLEVKLAPDSRLRNGIAEPQA